MPVWLQVFNVVALLTIAVATAWDRFFKTRRGSELDRSVDKLSDRSWTLDERLSLEHRLTEMRGDIDMLIETNELREKIMAKIVHSPHRPALDRLLEKIEHGEALTLAEITFAKDWLWQIIEAIGDEQEVTKGDRVSAGDLYSLLHMREKKIKAERAH